MDDLRIYDLSLSEIEILNIFGGKDLTEEQVYLQKKIDASGDPTSYASTTLPDGLNLDSITGEITGKPTKVGIYDVNVSATNLAGVGQAS